MTEFKFDTDDIDDQALRIVRGLTPLLVDENAAHIAAALVFMLASYITILSSEAGISTEEVDDTIDRMVEKIRRATHYQRAHYPLFSEPGNA